jgi:glycosyltransferase involved in cell wall biosynthesis
VSTSASQSRRRVVMIGTALDSPGGMTSVVRCFRDGGFFDDWRVAYLASFERPGLLTQLRVMSLAVLRFVRLVLTREVSLVHVHSASRGSFWRKSVFCAMARGAGIPYIFQLHSGEFPVFYQDECGPLARRWIRHTLERAASVVALTEGWRGELAVIAPGAHIIVIGNPVVASAVMAGDDGNVPNILFLGRLREKKGVFDLVRAVPDVVARVPGSHFMLAGDGELDAVRSLAIELGVSDAISLPGWVDGEAKDRLLASASVLVLPSYFEGLPVCVLEAMAAGVPVVASAVGGIPELLQSGECGWLVAPGDEKALARALIEALCDQHLRDAKRRQALLQIRKDYSYQTLAGRLSAAYSRAINREVSAP